MARASDLIDARLRALVAGTYTTGGRYVTGATFTEAKPVSSDLGAAWQDVVKDRMWDLVWQDQGDEGDEPQNTYQGPHILTLSALLRVQYATDRTSALEPPPDASGGSLGNLAAPTRRALGDAEQLRYIFSHTPVWSGVAIGCVVGRQRPLQTGPLRVVLEMLLTWQVAASADTAPGWGA